MPFLFEVGILGLRLNVGSLSLDLADDGDANANAFLVVASSSTCHLNVSLRVLKTEGA